MLNIQDVAYEYDMEFQNYETPSISIEPFQRQRLPFAPPPNANVPTTGNFPPGFNYPGGGFNPPGFNPPSGGGFNPTSGGTTQPGMPKSPPPNYTPNKNDGGVQSLSQSQYGAETKAVSSNSIRFCLYKYTYIWETNGRNYWAFLLNIDRRSASGFRWLGRRWVYFGVDLRRIDSFVCYNRSTFIDDCENCENLRQDDILLLNRKKEYSLTGARDVYTKTLASIDIPEIKEYISNQSTGYIDNNSIESEIPFFKTSNICYRISLEVTYPSDYDKISKNKINNLASEAGNDAYKILSSTRNTDGYSNPLETFNLAVSLIPEALNTFSNSFNSKLKLLSSDADIYKDISYCIIEEKDHTNWKPYY